MQNVVCSAPEKVYGRNLLLVVSVLLYCLIFSELLLSPVEYPQVSQRRTFWDYWGRICHKLDAIPVTQSQAGI